MSYLSKKITKPKSSAWNYFKQVTEFDGKDSNLPVVRYQCIYCAARYAGHATRLTKHLGRSCRKCPRSIASEFFNLLKFRKVEKHIENKTDAVYDSSSTDKNEFDLDVDKISIGNSAQQNLSRNVSDASSNTLDSKYQFIAESLYARAFYSGGLSLDFNNNEYWREFLNHLNSQFEIPSQLKLGQQLLQREYSFIKDLVYEKIEESSVLCLQCFLTSDEQGNFVVNFVVNMPKPLFHKSIAVSSKDEISYHVEHEIISVMNYFGSHKFIAVLTNDPSILEMLNIEIFDSGNLIRYNCAISSLNLFLEEILSMEGTSSLWVNSQDIVEEFRIKVPALSVASKSLKSNDWASIDVCFKNIIENENVLKSLISLEDAQIPKQVQKLIKDDQYWSSLKNFYLVIEPIFKWLNDLSTEGICISAVVNCFREIRTHIESTANDIFCENGVKKIRQLLAHSENITITPLHLGAHILDPKSNGSYLSDDEQILGSEFIDRVSGIIFKDDHNAVKDVLCELAKYRCQEGIFNAPYVLKTAKDLSPEIWWKGSCYGLKLSKVANFILSLPATTCALEHLLHFNSTDLQEHNLSPEQMNQYLFTYKNLKLIQPPTCLTSFEKQYHEENEEADGEDENLMSEEDISEIEYEITLDDFNEDD